MRGACCGARSRERVLLQMRCSSLLHVRLNDLYSLFSASNELFDTATTALIDSATRYSPTFVFS